MITTRGIIYDCSNRQLMLEFGQSNDILIGDTFRKQPKEDQYCSVSAVKVKLSTLYLPLS